MELRPGHPMKFNPEGGEFPVYDYREVNEMDVKATVTTTAVPKKAAPTPAEVLAAAPTVAEVLARPFVYEAWLKKAQEALNG